MVLTTLIIFWQWWCRLCSLGYTYQSLHNSFLYNLHAFSHTGNNHSSTWTLCVFAYHSGKLTETWWSRINNREFNNVSLGIPGKSAYGFPFSFVENAKKNWKEIIAHFSLDTCEVLLIVTCYWWRIQWSLVRLQWLFGDGKCWLLLVIWDECM